MNLEIPAIPAGVLALLAFFAPYAIAVVNRPEWSAATKYLVSVVVSIILTAVVMAFYYLITGDTLPDWPSAILLALVVSQAAYTLLLKGSAKRVESTVNTLGRHRAIE